MGETEMKMDEQQRAGSPKLRIKDTNGDITNDTIKSVEEQLEAVHNGVEASTKEPLPPEETFNGGGDECMESTSEVEDSGDKVDDEVEADVTIQTEQQQSEEPEVDENNAKGEDEELDSNKEGDFLEEDAANVHGDDDDDDAEGKTSILEGALKHVNHDDGEILHKVHVEEAREGCDGASPSSPGHAASETASNCDELKLELDACSDEAAAAATDDKSPKRKNAIDFDVDEPTKKLKKELQQECYLRNKILADYTETLELNSFEQMQIEEEKLADEIQKLDEIAREKERQWNNVIHVKKMKEELLERVKRRKQVCMINDGLEVGDCDSSGQKAIAGKQMPSGGGRAQMQPAADMNGHDRSSAAAARHKGPVRNVQSIIADYRQRHPETVPRRGRRIRNVINGGTTSGSEMNNAAGGKAFVSHAGGAITFANMALGSGAHVRSMDASHSDIAMLLNSIENTHHDILDCQETNAFKEFLDTISFPERKKGSSSNKQAPQLPEVTVHAVTSSSSTANAPTNSLLHGILTKNQGKGDVRTTFSPTLARLLTAPDKAMANQQKAANVSISDILSTNNKTRSEITITPVSNDYEDGHLRRKHQVQEEETEDSVDRLVIDENNELGDSRGDNTSDGGDEVPQCQGCNQKAAQFVCAGCGNQWYCSRECQVTAWDEHSDVCSG